MGNVRHIREAPSAQELDRHTLAIEELIELGLVAYKGDGTDTVHLTPQALRLTPYLTALVKLVAEKALNESYDEEAWSVVLSDQHWLSQAYL